MAETTKPPETPAAKKTTPATAKSATTSDRPTSAADRPQPGQSAGPVNPAGAAIRDAARQAEVDRLTQQRDELREMLGDAPTLEILRAEVGALQQAAARAGATRHRFVMSAGVAADLETVGYATDPGTGDAYVRDGDRVTVTSRTGVVRTVDMPAPSGAGEARPSDSDR